MNIHLLRTSAVLCFLALLIGCATPLKESAPEWKLQLNGIEQMAVTHADMQTGTFTAVTRESHQGVLLASLAAGIDGSEADDYTAWQSGYEITLTSSTGYAVTIDTRDYSPDDLVLVYREDASVTPLYLAGTKLPQDLIIRDVVSVEVSMPSAAGDPQVILEVHPGTEEPTYLTIDMLEPFSVEGRGAYTTSAGTYNEAYYHGIDILELVWSFGYGEGDTLTAVASDGFEMRYSVSEFMEDQEGTWILAYLEDGNLLAEGIGPFRVIKIGDPVPNIPGSRSARMVAALKLP